MPYKFCDSVTTLVHPMDLGNHILTCEHELYTIALNYLDQTCKVLLVTEAILTTNEVYEWKHDPDDE